MSYPFEPGELRGKPLTARQEEILVTVVNEGSLGRAARRLGRHKDTLNVALAIVRDKLGATHTTHAAVLLYPRLGDRYLESPARRLELVR